MGLRSSVTAITFVALGTSLPDTFASKVGEIAARSRGDRGEIVPHTLASRREPHPQPRPHPHPHPHPHRNQRLRIHGRKYLDRHI